MLGYSAEVRPLKLDYCRAIFDETNAETCVHADMPACDVEDFEISGPYVWGSPKGPPQLTISTLLPPRRLGNCAGFVSLG